MASVCRSLQCLISAVTQAGGGGPLFRFALFSRAPGREVRCRLMSLACVGRTRVFRPHWVCPAHGSVLPPSALLRLQAALQGAGPELRAVPVFGSSTNARTRLGLRSGPSPVGAAQAARSLMSAHSPGAVRLLPSAVPASVSARPSGAPCVSSGELISGRDPPADVHHPESQEVFG